MRETPLSLQRYSAFQTLVALTLLGAGAIPVNLATSALAGLLCYITADFRPLLSRSPLLIQASFSLPGVLMLIALVRSADFSLAATLVACLPVAISLYLVTQVAMLSPRPAPQQF